MSQGHFSRSSEIAHLVAEVRRMSPQERRDIHGMEIHDDGTVSDETLDDTFKNIQTWAQAVVESDTDEFDEYNTDDDYDEEDY